MEISLIELNEMYKSKFGVDIPRLSESHIHSIIDVDNYIVSLYKFRYQNYFEKVKDDFSKKEMLLKYENMVKCLECNKDRQMLLVLVQSV